MKKRKCSSSVISSHSQVLPWDGPVMMIAIPGRPQAPPTYVNITTHFTLSHFLAGLINGIREKNIFEK